MINLYVKANFIHRGNYLDDSDGVRDWYDDYKVNYTLYSSHSTLPLTPLQLLYLYSLLSNDRYAIWWENEKVEEAEEKKSREKTRKIVYEINSFIEDNIFESGDSIYNLTDYLIENKNTIDNLIRVPKNDLIDNLKKQMSDYHRSLHFYDEERYDYLRDEYKNIILSEKEREHNKQMAVKYRDFCAPLLAKIKEIEKDLCPLSPGRLLWENHLWNINEKWNNAYPLDYACKQKDYVFFHDIIIKGGTRVNNSDYKQLLLCAMKSNSHSLSDYYKLKKLYFDKVSTSDKQTLISEEYRRAIELQNAALIFRIFETNKEFFLNILSDPEISIYTLQKDGGPKDLPKYNPINFVMNEYIQPIVCGTFETYNYIDYQLSELKRKAGNIYHFC